MANKAFTVLSRVTKATIMCGCLYGGFAAANYIQKPEVKLIEKLVTVPEPKREFDEYLSESARAYGVPETIAAAMAFQESRGRMDAIRYEPGQVERAKKLTGASGEQLRMYASSHCGLQVMGWHTPQYGLKWSDLYDPRTCADLGMKIMADCLKRHAKLPAVDRTFNALVCYNGGKPYANEIMGRLAEKLLKAELEKDLS